MKAKAKQASKPILSEKEIDNILDTVKDLPDKPASFELEKWMNEDEAHYHAQALALARLLQPTTTDPYESVVLEITALRAYRKYIDFRIHRLQSILAKRP